MVVLKRVAEIVALVALVVVVAMMLSTCGSKPAAGDPCERSDLWHEITLNSGEVLTCAPEWGTTDRQRWTLVGYNDTSGRLVWAGWAAAVVGGAALTVGVVGILIARYGRRRRMRRSE